MNYFESTEFIIEHICLSVSEVREFPYQRPDSGSFSLSVSDKIIF